jgi:hypothetical protein
VKSSCGVVRFTRDDGFGLACTEHIDPADIQRGLPPRAPASPRIQEIGARTALRAPAGPAQDDVRRRIGIAMDAASIHREACRQGDRASAFRARDEELTQKAKGIQTLAGRAVVPKAPFTRVIEIDAWNIRERDNWGRTKAFLKAGKELGRWHGVYTGTSFRLDQRGTTAAGRPVMVERGYGATRQGLDRFRRP